MRPYSDGGRDLAMVRRALTFHCGTARLLRNPVSSPLIDGRPRSALVEIPPLPSPFVPTRTWSLTSLRSKHQYTD